jgi:predicted transposase YbfD/YdcC
MPSPAAQIYEHFENITDPRLDRGCNHPLIELIFVALTATICGCNSWASVERFANAKKSWFLKYISLPNGIPSHDTFSRVFSRLDSAQFLVAMHGWVDQFADCLRGQGVAIDGKVLRGSFDRAAGQSALHTITAFATRTRICLRQMTVDSKSNEIPAVPDLLKLMDLDGAIVTLDAMHCQVDTAQAIVDARAEYILTVKGNQPSLYELLHDLFIDAAEESSGVKTRTLITRDRGHGRDERRQYQTMAPPDHPLLKRWPGLRSITLAYRTVERSGKEHEEIMFYLSSLTPKVKTIAEHIRGHWSIENSLHHILDVTFTEDSSRIRKGSGPEITAGLRRMALDILQQDTTIKDNIKGKRERCGWDETVLDRLFTAF